MIKRTFSYIGLALLMVLMTGVLTVTAAPAPPVEPNVTITLIEGLPATMNLGDTATVTIDVSSDTPFLYAQALPTAFFPGRGVVASKGDHVGSGTTARLEVTFTAKNSTTDFAQAPADGVVPVSVVVGVRFAGGYVVTQQFDFFVKVP